MTFRFLSTDTLFSMLRSGLSISDNEPNIYPGEFHQSNIVG